MKISQFIWFFAFIASILSFNVTARGDGGSSATDVSMGTPTIGGSSSTSTGSAHGGADNSSNSTSTTKSGHGSNSTSSDDSSSSDTAPKATATKKKKGRNTELYGTSCYNAAGKFNFGCPIPVPANLSADLPDCLCKSEVYIQTVVGCIKQHATNKTLEKNGYSTIKSICTKSKWDYASIATQLDKLPSLKNENDYETLQSSPFEIPISLFNHEVSIMNQNTVTGRRDLRYPGAVLAYWAGIFLLRAITNLCYYIFPKLLLKFDNRLIRKFRQKVLMPPTGRYHHSTHKKVGKFTLTIPLRSESLTILGHIILNFVLCFSMNDVYSDSYNNPSLMSQFSKELANRAGNLTVSQLLLGFLFAGRNNFLIWLTGWPLPTFNVFHKWANRTMYVNLIIHAIAETINVGAVKYHKDLHQSYFIWGIIAITASGISIAGSIHYFRSMSYEVFLITHITLAAITLAGAWLHLAQHRSSYQYVYAIVAVWCFDRLLRIARIFWSGVTSKADVTLRDGDVVEFKIDYSKRWSYFPGSYAFIHVIRPNCFWQSHPFTFIAPPKVEDNGKLVMYAKVKKGFTKKMEKYLLTQDNKTARLPILIDGPYGHHYPVKSYETVVLFAGGIGITGVYPYADELRRHTDKQQKMVVVWAIADERPLEWFSKELEYLSQDSRIDLRIHVGNLESSSSSMVDLSTSSSPEKEKGVGEKTKTVSVPSMIPRENGRPNIDSVVEGVIAESTKSIAFICCGPDGMNDDTRSAITNRLDSTNVRMDYFEESFGW